MRILHLYPDLMNLYGDYANVTVLAKHLQDIGIDVTVDRKEIQDLFDPGLYDFIYMGSGTESAQIAALNDLLNYRMFLKKYIEDDKVILFTGNAMELFGRMIDERKALGFVDFAVKIDPDKRYTGDVIVKNEQLGELVGFINKSSLITGGSDSRLFDYVFRHSELPDNDYEGYRYRNLFGTHLLGPVLVKNPTFLELIMKLLAKEKYLPFSYQNEADAYDVTLSELKKRK